MRKMIITRMSSLLCQSVELKDNYFLSDIHLGLVSVKQKISQVSRVRTGAESSDSRLISSEVHLACCSLVC